MLPPRSTPPQARRTPRGGAVAPGKTRAAGGRRPEPPLQKKGSPMKSLHIVALRDGNGRFASVDTADGNVVRFSKPESWVGYSLLMTQADRPGRYTIKPYDDTPGFGVTDDGMVRAFREQPFIADPPEGPRMTLRTESGQVLAIDDLGRLIARKAGDGPGATLEVVVLKCYEDAVHGMGDCCGNHHDHSAVQDEEDGRLTWNDAGHQTIVRWAKEILNAHRGSVYGAGPVCDAMANAEFWRGVTTGLKDADNYDPRYSGIFFSSHFYDPDTGRNYLGFNFDTALTEAERRFREAASAVLNSGTPTYDAGFSLGLALHYLTDLTQPMHASNFIQFHSGAFDTRHSQFEGFLDNELARSPQEYRLDPARVRPAEAFSDAALKGSTTDQVKAVARYSKDVFIGRLRPILDRVHGTFVEGDLGIPYPTYDPGWVQQTRAFLPDIVRNAQLETARFLVRWGRAITASNLKNFANAKMQQGDGGVWTFSANGADGTWRRGDYKGHSAVVTRFTRSQLTITGEFCSFWWGTGEVIPFYLDLWYDTGTNGWKVHCRDGGSESLSDLKAPRVVNSTLVFDRILPPGVVGESALELTPLNTDSRWYGGIQLKVALPGISRFACFEDKTNY